MFFSSLCWFTCLTVSIEVDVFGFVCVCVFCHPSALTFFRIVAASLKPTSHTSFSTLQSPCSHPVTSWFDVEWFHVCSNFSHPPNTHTTPIQFNVHCYRDKRTIPLQHRSFCLFCLDSVWHPMYWFHCILYFLRASMRLKFCWCLLACQPACMCCGSNIKLVSLSKLPTFTILSSALCDNIWW